MSAQAWAAIGLVVLLVGSFLVAGWLEDYLNDPE